MQFHEKVKSTHLHRVVEKEKIYYFRTRLFAEFYNRTKNTIRKHSSYIVIQKPIFKKYMR